MDSSAGKKLKRLKRGLVPATSGVVSDWASSVVTERSVKGYNESEVAAVQDVLETKRGLIAQAEQKID
ncbi:hypothetical protein E8E14_012595 [Neopestalotiopsis sp. 37M]|nr:hypothetical protein E8E14_012595 [Neopestalotiopsis sp. 37M]